MRHPRHSKHRSSLGLDHLARMAQGACAAVPAEPKNRAIAVHPAIMREALSKVYGADALLKELSR